MQLQYLFLVSYAQAAVESLKQENIWTKVELKIKKKKSRANQSSQYREKHLVIISSDLVSTIDSMNVRNKINKTLETKRILKAMISII